MRVPYTRTLVHLVWSTWDRLPLLDADLQATVHASIASNARSLGCDPVHVGGVADHVHVLAGLPPALSVAKLAQRLKGASSHLVNHALRPGAEFRWQGGYGAFVVEPQNYLRARDYVGNQQAHHASPNAETPLAPTTERCDPHPP